MAPQTSTDRQTLTRVAKYFFEGIAVAIVAVLMGGLTPTKVIAVACAAAAAFAIIDLVVPSICVTQTSRDAS